ncbi:entericidin [Aquamicrobium sp. LC103]|uniref:entericidin domain-containing protein n=1 Tax=Aquamicrobium sp. LC103 TaxID=1120658 RepID=UPI00063E91EC|nr:entericidin [Aquamicrobium sp. LC103]TKT80043.1 entericidin [Aquamicrobium sp. LC103]
MTASFISRIAVVLVVAGFAAGCANTIRGMGQDTAGAVTATQQAGQNIDRAARY